MNPLVRSNADLPPRMCRVCLQMGHMGNECPTYRGLVARGRVPAFVLKDVGRAAGDGDAEPPAPDAETQEERGE